MTDLSMVRTDLLKFGSAELIAMWPMFIVFCGALAGIIASVVRFFNNKLVVFIISLSTISGAVGAAITLMQEPPKMLFNQMLICDPFSNFFNTLFLLAAAVTIIISYKYLEKERLHYPEYYLLVLFSLLGMMLMVAAQDLIVFFIALETMSLSVYALVGFRRSDRRSNESSMKYFILGAAASAIFLYGVALLYGMTSSTDLKSIQSAILSESIKISQSPALFLGVWLVVMGFLFKVASVPFHMWMPDVYEGAPAPITGFMTTGLKAAAFATFLRVFHHLGYWKGLSEYAQNNLHDILWISALLTMTIGNLVALTQTNLKRLLAYSSIAHTGYLFIGFIAGPKSEFGDASIVLYLAVYVIMNLGAFGVLTLLAKGGDGGLNLHDLSGLSSRHPFLAFMMAVFFFSMAGIPPTAGFVAKYYLFYSGIQAGEIWLVVLGVLCSAVSVYYYLRVIVYMYMKDAGTDSAENVPSTISFGSGLVVATLAVLVLQIGILPEKAVEIVKKVVNSAWS